MEDKSSLDIVERFDRRRAQNYDCQIRMVVPGYEVLHSTVCSILQLELREQAHLLIVGAGTGTEIVHLGEINQRWQFTGIDPSPDMIAVARQHVTERSLSKRVKLHTGLAHELLESEPYDAATLILVMHFVPDDGEKLRLLRDVYTRLKPGAPLILADLHGDITSDRFARFLAIWRRRQLALGMTAEEIETLFQNILSETQFISEERTTDLIYEAGFDRVEPFCSTLLLGGWVAYKGTLQAPTLPTELERRERESPDRADRELLPV